MMNMLFFWCISALFFLLFELLSPGLFYFISFALGSLCAAIIAWFDVHIIDQSALFLVASMLSCFALKTWIKWFGNRGTYHSNIYALQGKTGVLISPPHEQYFGYVHIAGEVWACKVLHEATIVVGSTVRVVDVKGAHLIVTGL